jgi:ribosomal protein S18 acetylase RimI-like enzyme
MSRDEQLITVDFLFEHLEEYGDSKTDIAKSIQFALKEIPSMGGFILQGLDENGVIIGIVVINHTGMSGYIPENILVYIAVNKKHRGLGYGKKLMLEAIKQCNGDIALHVEKENPARFLYENVGFTNPYLEMRYKNI